MNNIDYLCLGSKIKQKRTEKSYTQEKFAELCEISPGFLSHIEAGTRALSLETLYKIAHFLGVSTDYLLLDTTVADDNFIVNIAATIKDANKQKYDRFCRTVKILAENIDEL